jgi:hypothetical protein
MAIVGEAHIVVRAITTGFKKDVEDSLRSVNGSIGQIGEKTGKDFSDSLRRGMGGGAGGPFSSITKQADAARKKLNTLIKTGYALGPALAGAVGAISALVSGLFAIASAAGAAAPALVVLPGILTAVVQAGIAAKLAFMGVGKAISALMKQKTGAGAGGSDNSKQIADARKALARAYQTSADQMAAANDRVRKAQVALNQAYAKGAESLQQLGFDAEDAAIAQDKAALELERARETLMRVQDLPPNNRARREAEMAFKEADLNYRQAVDRSNDLAKAQEYAARTGIEGTEEVLSAKEDLADAESDLVKTQRDNAQSIADAQENLQDALNRTKETAVSVADPLAGLPKSAADFALFIAGLKPRFDELRAAAADGLFPKLTIAIQTLVDNLFPRLIPILYDTSSAIGDVAIKFADMLTTTENMDRIDRIFGDTNIKVIEDLGDAAVALGEGFLIILDAARPLIERFSEWVKITTEGWTETLKAKDATGELTDIFNNAGDAAAVIGGALGSAGGAFFELGKGAKDAGLKIIKAFDDAMDKLKAFAVEGNKTGELAKKFDQIADNVIAIGGFLGELTIMLFDLGTNPGIATFFDKISAIPGILAPALNTLLSTGGTIGDFFVSLSETFAILTESGGITAFFEVLTTALDAINALFGNEVVMDIFKVLAAIKGVTIALGVITGVAKFAGLNLIGAFSPLVGIISGTSFTAYGDGLFDVAGKMEAARGSSVGFKKGLGNLTAGFQLLAGQIYLTMAPLLPWIALGALVAGALYLMWENSEILRDAVKTLTDAVGGALNGAMETINDAIKDVMPSVDGLSGLFKTLGDFVGRYVVPILQFILVGAIRTIADAIAFVIKFGAGFLKALFVDPIQGIKDMLDAFGDFFKDRLVGTFRDAKAALGKIPLFDGIIESAKSAFNSIGRAWNNTIGKFKMTIPSWVPNYGGKTWSMPNFPMLAEGGVVRPTAGGTLALIAEAGRSERVEPLDSQGLSVRDRAIIAQLSGGGTNGASPTFNIYPSERMDERALASVVSRNVIWSMRRGA